MLRSLLPLPWLALAFWFVWTSSSSAPDVEDAPPRVDAADIAVGPFRASMHDPPRVVIGGVEQRCSDCHALFDSLDVTPGPLRQHAHVRLDHGLNDRCLNCHAQEDRNELVLHDGSLVGFDASTDLCAQCHGTLFRDWERGMHGRTVGSWDRLSPEHDRLRCVDCHDPHAPAFPDIELLPGPRTDAWRPPAAHHPVDHAERNPLERWKAPSDPWEDHP